MKPGSDPLQRLFRAAAEAPHPSPAPLPRPDVARLRQTLFTPEPAGWDPWTLRRALRPALAAAWLLFAAALVLSLAGLHTIHRDVFTTSQAALTSITTP